MAVKAVCDFSYRLADIIIQGKATANTADIEAGEGEFSWGLKSTERAHGNHAHGNHAHGFPTIECYTHWTLHGFQSEIGNLND